MLEHSTTVRAETVDKAIEKGLRELNIPRSEADIHIISEGKKGVFGFGKQDAIVEISAKSNLSLSEITKQLEEEQRAENNIQEKTEPEVVEVVEVVQPKEVVEPVKKPQEVKVEKPVIKKEVIEVELEKTEVDSIETLQDDDQSEKMTIEEASEKVAAYIQAVTTEYGAQSTVDFKISRSQVMFNIDTEKSGLVIGKHGKIINSLQILAQTYFQSLYRRRTSVLLNVGDYRDRRANVLQQIAQRTADEVIRTKQPVILDPLPSYERKQIHAHLSRIDRVKTHSEGKEPNRYLVVEYK